MKHLNIAVGIIRNAREIFITRRAADAHMAGFWEFPGGKIEQGETPEQALSRELRERDRYRSRTRRTVGGGGAPLQRSHRDAEFLSGGSWAGEPYGREATDALG